MFEHQQLAFPPLSQGDASLAVFWRRLWEGRDGLVAPSAGCPPRLFPSEPRAGCGPAPQELQEPEQGCRQQVLPALWPLCPAPAAQVSVNSCRMWTGMARGWAWPCPNSCFSCPRSSVCSWVLLAVLNPNSQSRGLAVPAVPVFPVRHWQHSGLEPCSSWVARRCARPQAAASCSTTLKFSDKQTATCLT